MTERVWDRFLTEQARAHLAKVKHRPMAFGQKPALLLIDLYRWVFGDRPQPLLESVEKWPSSCGMAGWNALPHIQTLLSTAREVGIPVIHITGGIEIDGWAALRGGDQWSNLSPEEREERRSRFVIMDEVAPLPGETVLRKSSPSAFWGTPLVGHLNLLGVDTIITCGESTSGCVRASVVDGCTNRFRMIVVEEGVFDRHEACHAINLFDMDQKYANVLPLAESLRYLRSPRG